MADTDYQARATGMPVFFTEAGFGGSMPVKVVNRSQGGSIPIGVYTGAVGGAIPVYESTAGGAMPVYIIGPGSTTPIDPTPPIEPSANLLGSFDFTEPGDVDSFERAQEAGYTGSGETAFQREVDVDVLRDGHYQGGVGPCVILEDDPTEIALAAPTNVVATDNGDGTFDATWDNLAVMANVDHWLWRLNDTGVWTVAASNSLTNAPAGIGENVLNVKAVSDISSTEGAQGDSEEFTVTSDDPFQLLASTDDALGANGGTSSNIDSTGADLLVAVFVQRDSNASELGTFADSKGNTWVERTTSRIISNGQIRWFDCVNPVTVGSGHNVSLTGTDIRASVVFMAYAAAAGSVIVDQENRRETTPSGTSHACGPISPAKDGALVLAAIAQQGDSDTALAGYSYIGGTAQSVGVSYGMDVYAKIEDGGPLSNVITSAGTDSCATKTVSYLSGAGAYTENFDPATLTTGTTGQENTYTYAAKVTLPAGVLRSIGLYINGISFAANMKLAIYKDSDKSLVADAGVLAVVGVGGGTFEDQNPRYFDLSGLNVSIGADDYYVAMTNSASNAVSRPYGSGGASDASFLEFSTTYAAQPTDPLTGADSTTKLAVRAYVE